MTAKNLNFKTTVCQECDIEKVLQLDKNNGPSKIKMNVAVEHRLYRTHLTQ